VAQTPQASPCVREAALQAITLQSEVDVASSRQPEGDSAASTASESTSSTENGVILDQYGPRMPDFLFLDLRSSKGLAMAVADRGPKRRGPPEIRLRAG